MFGLLGLIWWPMLIAAIVAMFDAHARWHEYEEVHALDYSPRLALVLRGSWCRRGVAEAIWPEAHEFYRRQGYSWFSVFPDGAPLIFFKVRFWGVVFGIRGGRMRGTPPKIVSAICKLFYGGNSKR